MTGYCVKCRETREIQNAEQVTMKNGRPATRGTCPVCNTGITGLERLRSGDTARRRNSVKMKI